jgi:hypothetical protein
MLELCTDKQKTICDVRNAVTRGNGVLLCTRPTAQRQWPFSKVDYSYYSEAQILILTSVPAPPAATVSSVHWLAGRSSAKKNWRYSDSTAITPGQLQSSVSSCLRPRCNKTLYEIISQDQEPAARFPSQKTQGKKRWLVAASGDRVLPALPSPGKPNLNLPAPAIHNRCSSLLPTKQPRNTHDDALIVRKELPVVFPLLFVSLLLVSRDSRFLSLSLAVDLEMRPEPVRLLTFKEPRRQAFFFYFEHHTADDSVEHYDFYEYHLSWSPFCLNCPAIFDVFSLWQNAFSTASSRIQFSVFSSCE